MPLTHRAAMISTSQRRGTGRDSKLNLAPVDWKRVDAEAPRPLRLERSEYARLPHAPIVVVTWTESEWAALEHVFCSSARSMTPHQAQSSSWQRSWIPYKRGWRKLKHLPPKAPSRKLGAWGRYRMVTLGPERAPVLLVKSDMHVSTDGPHLPLEQLIQRIAEEARPELLLTIGTAGGSRLEQCIGTVVVSNAFKLHLDDDLKDRPFRADFFTSDYRPDGALAEHVRKRLFRKIPVRLPKLRELAKKVDRPLSHLMNSAIEPSQLSKRFETCLVGDPEVPTALVRPVRTSNGYGVATTDGNYSQYSCVEMDDGLLAKVASDCSMQIGSIRNVSDPVVNADLDTATQQSWSYELYSTYGLYTSENGALATWALIKGNDTPG